MLPWATTEQDDRLLSDPHLLLLPLVTHGHVVPCFLFDQELTSADYPLRTERDKVRHRGIGDESRARAP